MVDNSSSVSYAQALDSILDMSSRAAPETISLAESYQRVTAEVVTAKIPEPCYNQSLRDGFVVGATDRMLGGTICSYKIMGEIPAGKSDVSEVKPGEAYRIMTGGVIPDGVELVVQQEDCHVSGELLEVPVEVVDQTSHYIQEKGVVVSQGQLLAPAGSQIGSREVALFAATGNAQLSVFRNVHVSFFCTGSELVAVDEAISAGKKICSNRYLLDALIKASRAIPADCGIVDDDSSKILELLGSLADAETDVIISTGGTGPGKYDLLEPLFEKLGGRVVFRSIEMSPGRSTLFGMIAGKLYFGLPGPPSAVTILFRELVLPAVRKMQGLSEYQHQQSEALLSHDVRFKKSGFYTVKEGIIFTRESRNYVRFSEKNESPNCHILLRPASPCPVNGEAVTVHRIDR